MLKPTELIFYFCLIRLITYAWKYEETKSRSCLFLLSDDKTEKKKAITERCCAIVTICSNNYLHYATVLFNSLKSYHPEAKLFLCLADKINNKYLFFFFLCF